MVPDSGVPNLIFVFHRMELEQRITKIVSDTKKLIKIFYPQFGLKAECLTIFSQNENDYLELINMLSKIGDKSEAHNGFMFTLHNKLEILGETIDLIRIRKHDVHRHEVGCCDFSYKDSNYQKMREIALDKGLDIVVRKEYEMIELSTFEIEAYAYIFKFFN